MYFNGTPSRPISVYSTNEFLTYIPNRGHHQRNCQYETMLINSQKKARHLVENICLTDNFNQAQFK